MSNFIPYRHSGTKDLFWLKDKKRGVFICLSLRNDVLENSIIPQEHMVLDGLEIFDIEELPHFTDFNEKNLSWVLDNPFNPY